jgi:hypothetical protein
MNSPSDLTSRYLCVPEESFWKASAQEQVSDAFVIIEEILRVLEVKKL